VNSHKLASHLQVDRYGAFWLTDAIRPSYQRQVIPEEGYRVETYRDADNDLEVPALAAAISREKLFDVFLELISSLGEVVDVVLETSHDGDGSRHRDLHRENIDLPVLQSHLYDFEDLLLHDGCTGIAVLSTSRPVEIQFDEHKLLVVYGDVLDAVEEVLRAHGIPRNDDLKLITEGEHLHNTTSEFLDDFEQMCYRLGVSETAETVNW
jgi:hypothetical protein